MTISDYNGWANARIYSHLQTLPRQLLHAPVITNHGSYHRGNISAMLHQLGHTGVPTDYGFYLYHRQQR